MKYKMIISDVDGTLIKSANFISPKTKTVISRFQQQGGIFTLATGRFKKAIDPFIKELRITSPVILYNGAQITDSVSNQVLFENFIDQNTAHLIIEIIENSSLDIVMYVNEKPFVREFTPGIKKYMEKIGTKCELHQDLKSVVDSNVAKVLLIGDRMLLESASDKLGRLLEWKCNMMLLSDQYLEIVSSDVSKGKALIWLADKMNIPLSDIIAVGDEYNDLSMIRAAGLGVAVSNATDEVKDAADIITKGSWNYGLAEVINSVL